MLITTLLTENVMQKIRILYIRRITVHAREHEDKFIKLIIKHSEKHFNRQPHDNHKELKQTKKQNYKTRHYRSKAL